MHASISIKKTDPLFPKYWVMKWHGDTPYLDRPVSVKNGGVRKSSRRRPTTKISVQRQPGMKPGDKGRVTLPDGRLVEYVVPEGEEETFIVAF